MFVVSWGQSAKTAGKYVVLWLPCFRVLLFFKFRSFEERSLGLCLLHLFLYCLFVFTWVCSLGWLVCVLDVCCEACQFPSGMLEYIPSPCGAG